MKRFLNFDVFIYSIYIKNLYLIVQLAITFFIYHQVTTYDVPVEVQVQRSIVADLKKDAETFSSLSIYKTKYQNAKNKLDSMEEKALPSAEDTFFDFLLQFLLYSLLWRFFCEFTIVAFKLHENLDSIAVKLDAKAAPDDDPPLDDDLDDEVL